MPCKWVYLFIGAQLENLEGIHLPGLFERKGWYMWVQFLDPEDIKILSLGAIWNFGKGTGLSWTDIRLWVTKGPSVRPRCIGTVGALTQCKSVSQFTSCQIWGVKSLVISYICPLTLLFLVPKLQKSVCLFVNNAVHSWFTAFFLHCWFVPVLTTRMLNDFAPYWRKYLMFSGVSQLC